MNNVEFALLESMNNEKFQKTINDDFTFIDSLIDCEDLDNSIEEEQ